MIFKMTGEEEALLRAVDEAVLEGGDNLNFDELRHMSRRAVEGLKASGGSIDFIGAEGLDILIEGLEPTTDETRDKRMRQFLVRAMAGLVETAGNFAVARKLYHQIFGAPGDYGYDRALGKALQALYGYNIRAQANVS